MTPLMKSYYLLQASYWTQQLLVLLLGLEKPRKDFTELIVHHFVTIYLVGASYYVNLTWIGNAIFITMDVSDVFLAVSSG
jgi:acyl-CoA-dependent ceramide synthase